MALIVCTECNKEISDKAKICPGCGAPKSTFPKSNLAAMQKLKSGIRNAVFWCFLIFFGGIATVGGESGYGFAALISAINAFMLFIFITALLLVLFAWRSKFPKPQISSRNVPEKPVKQYDWHNDPDQKPFWKLFEHCTFSNGDNTLPVLYDSMSLFRKDGHTWFKLKLELDENNFDEMICLHIANTQDLIVPSRYEVRETNNNITTKYINGGAVKGEQFSDFGRLVSGLTNIAGAMNFSVPPPYVIRSMSILSSMNK